MADQPPDLPWELLVSNLHWTSTDYCACGVTNLRPIGKEKQVEDFNTFANVFIAALEEHALRERKKYPDHYDPPQDTDVIIDEALARKIAPTVRRWRNDAVSFFDCDESLCGVGARVSCLCPSIPSYQRTVAAFCGSFQFFDCYYGYMRRKKPGVFNCEIANTLLLYGVMEPLLRVCAHPRVAIGSRYIGPLYGAGPLCGSGESAPWDYLFTNALMVYLCLNVMYRFPDIWEPNKPDEKDYRHTASYQHTLRSCTGLNHVCYSSNHPFRRFFGIEDRRFACRKFLNEDLERWLNTKTTIKPRWAEEAVRDSHGHWRLPPNLYRSISQDRVYGSIPFDEFLAIEMKTSLLYLPTQADVHHIRLMLIQKGLPMELILMVMEFADYRAKRTLRVAHDPLHTANRETLNSFLQYCWKLLVRITLLINVLGMKGYHPSQISDYITSLWEDKCGGVKIV